jgi:heme exporter protein D
VYFENFSSVLAMDGHGGFVWSAYAVTAIVIVLLIALPVRRRRRQVATLADQLRRDNPGAGSRGNA